MIINFELIIKMIFLITLENIREYNITLKSFNKLTFKK